MMKRMMAMVVILMACLLFTACSMSQPTTSVSQTSIDSAQPSSQESSLETNTEPDYGEILVNNLWIPINYRIEYSMEYLEDGRCATFNGRVFTWELDGDRLTLSSEEGSAEYTIVETDGVYFLCSDKRTYVMDGANDTYEVETVEITLDNIGDYFEVVTGSVYEGFNEFGDKIGEEIIDYYTLRPEYAHALVADKSKMVVRRIERIYEIDEIEYTDECETLWIRAIQQAGYGFDLYGELVEVTKVEGTLTFVAALLE